MLVAIKRQYVNLVCSAQDVCQAKSFYVFDIGKTFLLHLLVVTIHHPDSDMEGVKAQMEKPPFTLR